MLTHICVINLFHQGAMLQVTKCDYPWLVGACLSPTKDGRWRFRLRKQRPVSEWKQMRVAAKAAIETASTPELQQDAVRLKANLRNGQKVPYIWLSHLLCWYGHGPPTMPGDMACHYSCGKAMCLNAHHISWGDHRDNASHTKWHHKHRTGQLAKGAICPQHADSD